MELAQDRSRLRKLIRALMDKAESGDVSALKELADRVEGKSVQPIEGTAEDGAIVIKWRD
jgi:ribosomal protein L18E